MVKRLWQQGSRLFSKRQNNIMSAAIVLMMAVMLSGILGLIRDRLLAATFFDGQRWQLDVYFAAFRLPDMLFQLVVLGALSAAFIPVYSSYLRKSPKTAWKIANSLITLATLVFLGLAVLIFAAATPLSQKIAPDFSAIEIQLMVNLTRTMLLAQLFFVVSNFITGILQSHQRFLIPAIAPVLYNLGIIGGIIWLSPTMGIYGPTYGVVIGSLLHLLIQLPLIKKLGFSYRPMLGLSLKGVRRIGVLMMPRTLSLAVSQLELTVAVFLASAMTSGSLSIFYFAQHLHALPINLFGLTIGQAALPMLSKEADNFLGLKEFKKLLISSLNYIVYLAMPASVLLLILRIPLVRIAFGAKAFPWEATQLTGGIVAVLAFSVVTSAVIQLLIRAFYALQDTRTPLAIGAATVVLNVGLSLWFTRIIDLGVVGLGLAITIASIFQALWLFIFLNQSVKGFDLSSILIPLSKILIASGLTGIALWLPMRLLDQFVLDTTRTLQLIILTIVATGSGFVVYFIFSKLLEIEELDKLLHTLKRFGSWKKILSQSEEVLSDTSVAPQTATIEE